jgi:hypothetical protein
LQGFGGSEGILSGPERAQGFFKAGDVLLTHNGVVS